MNEILIPVIEEQPGRNWKKAAYILIACFLMILCISGIIYIVYNTPEKRVMRGFGHLAEEIEELCSESNGLQGENNGPQDSGLQVSTRFNVSGEGLPNTIGVDTNIQAENAQKESVYDKYKVFAETKFSVMNNELATVSLYIDEQEDLIQAALLDFWDGHLEFAQDNLDSQYNKSVIADYWGSVPENGISLHLLTKRFAPQQFLDGMTAEEVGDVIVEKKSDGTVEKIENSMIVGTTAGNIRQYKCKQYRVWFPEAGITAEIALDRKNYIREIVLIESWKIAEAKSNMGANVLPEMICVENAQLILLGERHSIDDISVSIDMRIESEKWNWLTVTSFEKGVLQADLRLEGEVTCGGKGGNDTAVSFELSKLTLLVDGMKEYRVTGIANMGWLVEQPRPLTGEAVAITELQEETYQEIEENIRKEMEKWEKTYSAF